MNLRATYSVRSPTEKAITHVERPWLKVHFGVMAINATKDDPDQYESQSKNIATLL